MLSHLRRYQGKEVDKLLERAKAAAAEVESGERKLKAAGAELRYIQRIAKELFKPKFVLYLSSVISPPSPRELFQVSG